jgi:hypothetical protein
VIVLKIKFAAALGTLAAVSFEDCAADLTEDGLPLPLRPLLVAFVDVEHHVRPVHALSVPALAVPDQGQDVSLCVAAGLPVEGILEPPPDAGT